MSSAIETAHAAPPATAAQRQEPQQYLTFLAAEEPFAIGILAIREIIRCGPMTQVPRMPEFIRGVINLRGAVVPVIDLSARFGKPATEVNKRRTCIVIVEVEYNGRQHIIGMMVTAVYNVLEIPDDQIEPAPEFGARIRAEFIRGMGKVDGNFVMILDVNQVLSLDEISTLANLGKEQANATGDMTRSERPLTRLC